jgi:hypothetical protein
MVDSRLLKTETNLIFKWVEQSGLDPSEFDWFDEDLEASGEYGFGSKVSTLLHRPTGFYYTFGLYRDEYSPGHFERTGRVHLGERKWQFREVHFRQWLSNVRQEHEAPDLWQEILNQRRLLELAVAPRLENAQFSSEERDFVRKQFDELGKQIVSMHRLQLQQAEALENVFAYLSDSMNRFGKKDWLLLAIGTLVSVASNAAFSPAAAKALLHGFVSAIQPLFDAALRLLSA